MAQAVNDIDHSAVILKSGAAAEFPEAADWGTSPTSTDTVVLEAAVKVQAKSFYANVGPRQSGKPVPALSHLALEPAVPKATQYSAVALTRAAVAALAIAVTGAVLAWLIVGWSL